MRLVRQEAGDETAVLPTAAARLFSFLPAVSESRKQASRGHKPSRSAICRRFSRQLPDGRCFMPIAARVPGGTERGKGAAAGYKGAP